MADLKELKARWKKQTYEKAKAKGVSGRLKAAADRLPVRVRRLARGVLAPAGDGRGRDGRRDHGGHPPPPHGVGALPDPARATGAAPRGVRQSIAALVIMVLLFQRRIISGLTAGGVKS